eukprot:356261-Chlamydomonas_euryale.AAC.3
MPVPELRHHIRLAACAASLPSGHHALRRANSAAWRVSAGSAAGAKPSDVTAAASASTCATLWPADRLTRSLHGGQTKD